MNEKTPDEMWSFISGIEPVLQDLYDEARAIPRGDGPFCANNIWYGYFKPQVINLVGIHARRSELKSSYAYDVAYQKIYHALPDCFNCDEFPRE